MKKVFRILLLIVAATMPFATTAAPKKKAATKRTATSKNKKPSGSKLVGTADNGKYRLYNDYTIKTNSDVKGTWENKDGYMRFYIGNADYDDIGIIYHGLMYHIFVGSDIGMSDVIDFNPITGILQTNNYDGEVDSMSIKSMDYAESVSWKNTPGNHRICKITFPDDEYPQTFIFGDGCCEGLNLFCNRGDGYCEFIGRLSTALLINDYFIWHPDDRGGQSYDRKANTITWNRYNYDDGEWYQVTESAMPYFIPENKVTVIWYK